jgi:hypothetical protein
MMTSTTGKCRIVRVFAFRGDRTAPYWAILEQKMDDEDQGQGTGPTNSEVLLYAGHAGVSLDAGNTIFGFHPVQGTFSARQLLDHLKARKAVDGEVRSDAAIFDDARNHGLPLQQFDVLVPQARYDQIETTLAQERKSSNHKYGFPNGDGDCNCATWIERIGVPLLSGRMDELEVLMTFSVHHLGYQQRRFGVCVP